MTRRSPRTSIVSRHDLVLAAIALPMVLAGLVGALFPVQLTVALGAGSVPASGGVGYALFFGPPASDS